MMRPTDDHLIRAAVALDGCLFSKERQAQYVAALATLPGHDLESSAEMVRDYQDSVVATAAWLRELSGCPVKSTTVWRWEDIALEALKSLGRPDGSLSIEEIAEQLGLRVAPCKSAEAGLVGDTIMVSPRLSPHDRRSRIAQALAWWLIKRSGFGASDDDVAVVAGVLLARSKDEAAPRRARFSVLQGGSSLSALRRPREPRAQLRLCQ